MSNKVEISHLTFIVKDVEKSAQLFVELFGAKEVYDSKEKNYSIAREKFLLIEDIWLALMEGESLENTTYNHVAFKVSEVEMVLYRAKIKQLGLEIREGRPRIADEAHSIYFYDYDNHLFELHTGTLAQRLAGYDNNMRRTDYDEKV